MPPFIRFLLVNAAIGFAAAIVFVAGLIALDVNGLRTLMLASDVGWIALLVLVFFTGLTFASAQVGIAVMRHKTDADDDHDRRGGRDPDDRFPPGGPDRSNRVVVPVRIKAYDRG